MGISPRMGLAALAAVTLSAAGCATVQSEAVPTGAASASSRGLTYFLPVRLVKVTATRTPLKLEDLRKAAAAKAKELVDAKKAKDDAEAEAKRDAAVLAADPTNAGLIQAAAVSRAKAAVAVTSLAEVTLAAASADSLVLAAETSGPGCAYSAKIELLPAQADPGQRFVARLSHNWLRDDTFALMVTPAGLLSSSNVVAADRTGDIIVEIAGAMAGLQSPGRSLGFTEGTEKGDTTIPCAARPRQFTQVFDPVTQSAAVNANLAAAGYPLRLALGAIDNGLNSSNQNWSSYANGLITAPRGLERQGAIYYRSAVPVTLTIEQGFSPPGGAPDHLIWQPVDASIVMLPQAGPISYIPLNSSAFVKTVNDVQFADGSIASWSSDRPSEVLEIVRLPVKVLTAVVSVPAQLVSLRVDYSTKAKSLADAQRQQMEMENKLRVLKACVDRAQAAGTPSDACFSG